MKYRVLTNKLKHFSKSDIICRFEKWYYKEGDPRKDHYYLPVSMVENCKGCFEKIPDEDLAIPYEKMLENPKKIVAQGRYDQYEVITDMFPDFPRETRVFLCEDGKFRSKSTSAYMPRETVEDKRYCKPVKEIEQQSFQQDKVLTYLAFKRAEEAEQPLINRLHNFFQAAVGIKGYEINTNPFEKSIYHITIQT